MQSKYQKRFFWISLAVLCIVWNSPVSGKSKPFFDAKSKGAIEKGVLKKSLLIMPQLNQLNFGFGRYRGIEYLYEKTLSKIFFQNQKIAASVVDVTIENSEITLQLSHPILGPGSIRFSFPDELLQQTTEDDIQRILLETLGDENHRTVVLDPQSKLYHLWSCNHLSDPRLAVHIKREDAEAQGYRASPICFKKVLYLPWLSVEKAIEREWARRLGDYKPVADGSKKQALLRAVGKKILKNWPFKLLGYDYAFYLSDSRQIDAFAIPTGKIIISAALFNSLATEDELEALLVYTIAHIEQRHSLKEYNSCLKDEKYAAAMKKLADVAGALAGPASGVVSGALNAALPDASCNPQSLSRYPKDYVQEADAMAAFYFDVHGKDKRAIVSLIKKLQFSDLSEKRHPDLRLTHLDEAFYNDRLRRVRNTRFVHFTKGNHFILQRRGKPPAQLDLIGQRLYKKENNLLVYLDPKILLPLHPHTNGEMTTALSVQDKTGKHRFQLNDLLVTEDVWGAHLTFKAAATQKQTILQDIEKVVLTLAPASGPRDRESSEPNDKRIKGSGNAFNDQNIHNYTFVPGTITW